MTETDALDAVAARALRHLEAEGALRTVDAAFAALLHDRLHAAPAVALAGALAMRAVAMGHSSVALADMPALLDALGVHATLPDASSWALRSSPRRRSRGMHRQPRR